MLETSFTNTKSPQPGTQNGNFEFPQDISLFLAGAWTSNVGSFLQVTYDAQADHFSMDNTDIRYANKTKLGGKELVYGLDLNNNPTLEDLWNTTPAWGYRGSPAMLHPLPTPLPSLTGPWRRTSQASVAMRCGTVISIWTWRFIARNTSAHSSRTPVLVSRQHRRGCAVLARRLAGVNRDDAVYDRQLWNAPEEHKRSDQ